MKCAECDKRLSRTNARSMVSTYAMITHYFCQDCYEEYPEYGRLHKVGA